MRKDAHINIQMVSVSYLEVILPLKSMNFYLTLKEISKKVVFYKNIRTMKITEKKMDFRFRQFNTSLSILVYMVYIAHVLQNN